MYIRQSTVGIRLLSSSENVCSMGAAVEDEGLWQQSESVNLCISGQAGITVEAKTGTVTAPVPE